MSITRLTLKNFTVFADAKLEFCPGINVLIGENACGKTHVLKLLYASRTDLSVASTSVYGLEVNILRTFFGTRPASMAQLRRHDGLTSLGGVLIHNSDAGTQATQLDRHRPIEVDPDIVDPRPTKLRGGIFLPPRDVMAMYPGFVAAYENRELSFDATYYDLCRQLSAARLRGKAARAVADLLAPLERLLGGEVRLENDGFHLKSPERDISAPLLAEGWRKLGTLAYLIANGSLTENSILFIDEPEASLNPTLTVQLVQVLRELAHRGVQIFLASHDYLLVHRLSQASEHALSPQVPTRFFALHRPEPGAAVAVETADTLAQIEHNAILREFARYYDDEQRYTLDELAAPPPPPASKPRAKKPTAKKPTAKKSTAKKSTAKKTPAKKTPASKRR